MTAIAAANAAAQWVSPVEQTYGPYGRAAGDSGPALAGARGGVLLAWSEIDPITRVSSIRTGVLDSDGRLTTELTTLPTFTAGASATNVHVATDGETYFVCWLEKEISWHVVGILVDAQGRPASALMSFGHLQTQESSVLLVWTGDSYFLWAGGELSSIRREGTFATASGVLAPDAAYASRNTLVGIDWSSTDTHIGCNFGRPGCAQIPAIFKLQWTIVHPDRTDQKSREFNHYSTGVVVDGDEREMAVAWDTADSLSGARIVDGALKPGFRVNGGKAVPDSIAFDGERWLITFEKGGNVFGAFIERGTREATPFAIASSLRHESRSHAYVIAPGRFLVSYTSDEDGDLRFAGRVVTPAPPRRRPLG